MLGHTAKLLMRTQPKPFRCLSMGCLRMSDKPVKTVEPKAAEGSNENTDVNAMLRKIHAPKKFEKKMLVWTGRFKTEADVPDHISVEMLDKAKNKMRIKIANYMMLGTLLACLCMAISGKRAMEKGESVAKMNLDWHREQNKSKE